MSSVMSVIGRCAPSVMSVGSTRHLTLLPLFTLLTLSSLASANDDFADAEDLGSATSIVKDADTMNATAESLEPYHANQQATHSLWWKWTAPKDGPFRLDTFGSAIDTVLGVYTGTAVDQLTEVVANEHAGIGVDQSRVLLEAKKDTVYHIVVDGYLGAAGAVKLKLEEVAIPNDDFFSAAEDLGDSDTGQVSGTTFGAIATPGQDPLTIADQFPTATVWYTWTPAADGPVAFSTVADFDTVIEIFEGDDPQFFQSIRGNDDVSVDSRFSKVTFNATAFTTYSIVVDGFDEGMGDFTLSFAPAPPPTNDAFIDARTISGLPAQDFTESFAATAETGEPAHAGETAQASVWWKWTPAEETGVEITTKGSLVDTVLAVYTGSAVDQLTLVAENDDLDSQNDYGKVRFEAKAGTTYYLAVDGKNGETDEVVVNLTGFDVPPPNDEFADRQDLGNGTAITKVADNEHATSEPNEPDRAGREPAVSVWWTWTAPADGEVRVDTFGSKIDTLLGVYTGTVLDGLTEVAVNDDAPGGATASQLSFTAVKDTVYLIAVDAVAGEQGEITLSVSMGAAGTPNNDFADRKDLGSGFKVAETGTNRGATAETDEPEHAGQAGVSTIWYTWTATNPGPTTVDTLGSEMPDTVLAVYTGTDLANLTLVAENDDAAPDIRQSRVYFDAVAGQAYQIAIDGYKGNQGGVKVNVNWGTYAVFKADPRAFDPNASEADRAPEENPDNDALNNLEEFYFGFSPSVANTQAVITQVKATDGAVLFFFNKRRYLAGVGHVVEASDDLQTWRLLSTYQDMVTRTWPSVERVRIIVPTGAQSGAQYFRVRVEPR